MTETTYWDANTETMKTVVYTDSRSTAGYGSGPEYRVSYRLPDGQWLNGKRHKDRGNLMTHIRISKRPWCS